MNLRSCCLVLVGLALGLHPVPASCTEPSAPLVRDEIDYLLTTMGRSGCEFYRNGSWHDAPAAEAHIRAKYAVLAARNHIGTTEDFIDRAASRSSLTGTAYAVHCGSSPVVSSSSWLSGLLAQYRVARAPSAPRTGRGAPGAQP